MKTKEELKALKIELDNLNKKLNELSQDELKEVTGGRYNETPCPKCGSHDLSWISTGHALVYQCYNCGHVWASA